MTARSDKVSAAMLRECFDYNPDTGVFTWRVSPSRKIRVGDVAGSTAGRGYLRLSFYGQRIYAHRAAWLHVHGHLPEADIDHIDADFTNNRLANLRPATGSQNQANKPRQRNNTSGVKGVYWCRATSKWVANIKSAKRTKYLGSFASKDAAADAYSAAARAAFGEFARAA